MQVFLYMSNYKVKSSRAILKRFKITSSGKCLRRKACRSHLLRKKTAQRKQKLRKVVNLKYMDYILLKFNILHGRK